MDDEPLLAADSEDPFLKFGLGIYFLFNIIFTCVLILAIMSVIALIQLLIIWLYSRNDPNHERLYGIPLMGFSKGGPLCVH